MPLTRPKGDWELCGTVNGSWGYTGAKAKPLEKLLPYMVTAWGMGGNVLMNVGPTREGIIPEDSAERLRQVGAWLKLNGESIFGSTAGPFNWVPWGTATRKGDIVYLQVFDWPKDGVLKVPLANKVTKAWLLADPERKHLKVTTSDGRLLVHIPEKSPDPIVSVVALKLEGEPVSTYTSLSFNKPVTASSEQKPGKCILDGNTGTHWRNNSTNGFFEIDLGKPETFSRMRIGSSDDVKSYNLEYKDGDVWKPILQGKSLHRDENLVAFPSLTAQVVRFSFANDTKAPQIGVFELYPEL